MRRARCDGMTTILVILYAFYFILIGARGNAPAFLAMVGQEKQFLYWVVVLLVVTAVWDAGGVGSHFGPTFAALIVIGFLLSHNNGLTILHNAKAILPALGGQQA